MLVPYKCTSCNETILGHVREQRAQCGACFVETDILRRALGLDDVHWGERFLLRRAVDRMMARLTTGYIILAAGAASCLVVMIIH